MSPNFWKGGSQYLLYPQIFCDKKDVVVQIHSYITIGNP